jgi:insulysin
MLPAQHDAAHVEKLTKPEMIDFYKTFIDPTSPSRAKLVVQLIAQGASSKPEEVDAKKEKVTPPISNGTKPVLITSVRDFKARMAATAGPHAVHDLSEFEELDSKL